MHCIIFMLALILVRTNCFKTTFCLPIHFIFIHFVFEVCVCVCVRFLLALTFHCFYFIGFAIDPLVIVWFGQRHDDSPILSLSLFHLVHIFFLYVCVLDHHRWKFCIFHFLRISYGVGGRCRNGRAKDTTVYSWCRLTRRRNPTITYRCLC